MGNKKIQFPESYTNILSSEEVNVLAISLGMKFGLYDKFYDSSFEKICPIVCCIVRDNIKKTQIISEMKWDRVQTIANGSEDSLKINLSNISDTYEAEALCEISLSDEGVLPIKIAEKVGKIIRDLIKENHIHYAEAA